MAQLELALRIRIIRGGKPEAEELIDAGEALIGRASSCDVVVSSKHVSGRHVKILSGLVVVDLDSTNGTYLDGKRVRGAALISGRDIVLGVGDEDVRVQVFEHGAADGGATSVSSDEFERTLMVPPDALPISSGGPLAAEADDDGGEGSTDGALTRALQERDDLARRLIHMQERAEGLARDKVAQQKELEQLRGRSANSELGGELAVALDGLREAVRAEPGPDADAGAARSQDRLLLEVLSSAYQADRAVKRLNGVGSGAESADGAGASSSLQDLLALALEEPEDVARAERAGSYLTNLRSTLELLPDVCAQSAATLFSELQDALSREGLSAGARSSLISRWLGRADAELWSRSQDVLRHNFNEQAVSERFLEIVRTELHERLGRD